MPELPEVETIARDLRRLLIIPAQTAILFVSVDIPPLDRYFHNRYGGNATVGRSGPNGSSNRLLIRPSSSRTGLRVGFGRLRLDTGVLPKRPAPLLVRDILASECLAVPMNRHLVTG